MYLVGVCARLRKKLYAENFLGLVRDDEKVATIFARVTESDQLALYAAPALIYFWFFWKNIFW